MIAHRLEDAGYVVREARDGQEGLMIALGITGGALIAAGTALLVRGARQRRRAQLALDLRHNLVGLTIAGRF